MGVCLRRSTGQKLAQTFDSVSFPCSRVVRDYGWGEQLKMHADAFQIRCPKSEKALIQLTSYLSSHMGHTGKQDVGIRDLCFLFCFCATCLVVLFRVCAWCNLSNRSNTRRSDSHHILRSSLAKLFVLT